MQCLDDQLDHTQHLPVNSTGNTRAKWKVANKVGDKSNSQHWPSAKDKAMFHRSATPSLHCPWWVTLCLALLFASLHSVALQPVPSLTSTASTSAASASPLQPVLELNSSLHCTKEQVHNILASLIDDHHDEVDDAEHQNEPVLHNSRTKREVPKQTDFMGISQPKTKKTPANKNCYKKALHRCGRTFVNSYKFVRINSKNKNKDNDILVAQCALRTAFFDCLKDKANECNNRPKRADEPPVMNKHTKKEKDKDNRLRNRLAQTIWDSRICIFRNSLQFTPEP